MLNFRHLLSLPPRIIGALLLVALAGCSAVRIGYDNAPTLTYWWLDSYIDFTEPQTRQAREHLGALHAWHRKTELPAYAELLRQMQALAPGAATPPQVCALAGQIRGHMQRLGEQAALGMSAVTPLLHAPQLGHLARQFDKHNRKWRAEWLDEPPAEIAARRFKKAVERAEDFYGRLDEAQLALLRQSVASSSLDLRLSWRERLRRQQDMLQTLREHGGNARPAQARADLLALVQRNLNSPDPAYQAQFERMMQEACHTIAALHNSASAAQRRHLLETLQGYEVDVRALMAEKN